MLALRLVLTSMTNGLELKVPCSSNAGAASTGGRDGTAVVLIGAFTQSVLIVSTCLLTPNFTMAHLARVSYMWLACRDSRLQLSGTCRK